MTAGARGSTKSPTRWDLVTADDAEEVRRLTCTPRIEEGSCRRLTDWRTSLIMSTRTFSEAHPWKQKPCEDQRILRNTWRRRVFGKAVTMITEGRRSWTQETQCHLATRPVSKGSPWCSALPMADPSTQPSSTQRRRIRSLSLRSMSSTIRSRERTSESRTSEYSANS